MKRKDFIKNIFIVSITAASGATLSSCGSEKKKPAYESELNCGKNLTPEAKATREQYNYVEVSTEEDKVCTNCTHWRNPEKGEECGTCELVKGPINPLGYCDQWLEAPKKVS